MLAGYGAGGMQMGGMLCGGIPNGGIPNGGMRMGGMQACDRDCCKNEIKRATINVYEHCQHCPVLCFSNSDFERIFLTAKFRTLTFFL